MRDWGSHLSHIVSGSVFVPRVLLLMLFCMDDKLWTVEASATGLSVMENFRLLPLRSRWQQRFKSWEKNESDRQFRVFGIAEALATKRGMMENQQELDYCAKKFCLLPLTSRSQWGFWYLGIFVHPLSSEPLDCFGTTSGLLGYDHHLTVCSAKRFGCRFKGPSHRGESTEGSVCPFPSELLNCAFYFCQTNWQARSMCH